MENSSKLVEALKVFMDKSITPMLGDNHASLNEWKYLSGILSAHPIDPHQIDFYLLMANKSSINDSQSNHNYSSGIDRSINKSTSDNPHQRMKSSFGAGEPRRKVLLSNMQNFQGLMVRHQEKLQNFNKKDSSINYSQFNSSTNYTSGTKKYL